VLIALKPYLSNALSECDWGGDHDWRWTFRLFQLTIMFSFSLWALLVFSPFGVAANFIGGRATETSRQSFCLLHGANGHRGRQTSLYFYSYCFNMVCVCGSPSCLSRMNSPPSFSVRVYNTAPSAQGEQIISRTLPRWCWRLPWNVWCSLNDMSHARRRWWRST
jgi:hypothetical protein